jgi:hypothetical protein
MAHVEVVQTNTCVRTLVRGRLYVSDFRSKAPRPKVKASQKRMVCLLSSRAASALLNWGVSHPCHSHPHFTKNQILRMQREGEVEFVEGSNEGVAAWRQPRELKTRRSGSVTTVQWVPVGSGNGRGQVARNRE